MLFRRATAQDATLITEHRHRMFSANNFSTEEQLCAMDAEFEPWVRERLADDRYAGFIAEEDGAAIASAGVFFADFPPHFLQTEPGRPYLLNFYTADGARGRGLAKALLQRCVDECIARNYKVITLHASPFGKPIYERFGFEPTNEMMLKRKQI